jgi:hypothetical protein
MSLTQLLADYGYLAVFVGSLRGETVLVLAGFAAQQGYLSLTVTLTVAFVGGTLGDQIFLWLGPRMGSIAAGPPPAFRASRSACLQLLERHHAPVIIGIRFMYGLRIIGPIVIGACEVPLWRFAVFNMLGAAIWAPLGRRPGLPVRRRLGAFEGRCEAIRGRGACADHRGRRHVLAHSPVAVSLTQADSARPASKTRRADAAALRTPRVTSQPSPRSPCLPG